jgi:hypothetical protein
MKIRNLLSCWAFLSLAVFVPAALPIPASDAKSDEAPPSITRIWLTHRSNDPSRLVVSWMSEKTGSSVVEFGTTPDYGRVVRIPGRRTLHHVEIPLTERDATCHYRVRTGDQTSTGHTFKAYPTDVLRVAVVANWQRRPDLSALLEDDVHLLVTAGDNVSSIWESSEPGEKESVAAYADLVDAYPELFRSIPFMPAQGNHDREIRPRTGRPPPQPVYDLDATAFRRFFQLPDEEWKWRFDIPDFRARFIALDFHHISDHGTTWQSCRDFDENSEQFHWYKELMEQRPSGFIITVYNERNAAIRNQAGGRWHQLFRKGTACITGFGHYGERAELDGLLYYDTSLHGRGHQYPDPHSKAVHGEDNYMLLTFDRAERTLVIEMKNLEGRTLGRVTVRDPTGP